MFFARSCDLCKKDAVAYHLHPVAPRFLCSLHAWKVDMIQQSFLPDQWWPIIAVDIPPEFSSAEQTPPSPIGVCFLCERTPVWVHTLGHVYLCDFCYAEEEQKSQSEFRRINEMHSTDHQLEQKQQKPEITQVYLWEEYEPVEKLTLSHTQLESFWLHCQMKWAFKYIHRAPAAPSEALILGIAFHAALEEDGKLIMDGGSLRDYELLGVFDRVMKVELSQKDPRGLLSSKRVAMRAKAMAMFPAYIERIQPHMKPLAVEESFTIAIDEQTSLTGKIDVITEKAIVDWKTAGKPWTPGDQHGKEQATAYLIAKPEKARVSFVVFPVIDEKCLIQDLPTTRTDEQKAAYQQKILDVATEIRESKKTRKFSTNTGPLCGWCEYLGCCDAGMAWLKAKGKMPAVPVLPEARQFRIENPVPTEPAESHPQATQSTRSVVMATDGQRTSIRKLCTALQRSLPENFDALTFPQAKELLTQLSHDYHYTRQTAAIQEKLL